MQLKEVLEYLIENKYVVCHKNLYKFTSLFNKEISGIEKGLTIKGTVVEPNLPAVKRQFNLSLVNSYTLADWVHFYSEFIRMCDIPSQGRTSGGETYALNKYSEDGMKAYKKAIKDGYDPITLMAAIKVYYKGSPFFKKTISNYMKDGDWRTDYEQVKAHHENGTLGEYIKEETKDARAINYEIG